MKSAALFNLILIMLVSCRDQGKDKNIGSKSIAELNQAEIKQGDRTIVLTGAMLIDGGGGKPLGFAYFRELELLQDAGMQPMDIIQATTLSYSEFFKISDRLGTIERGKVADLILVDGNPLQRNICHASRQTCDVKQCLG